MLGLITGVVVVWRGLSGPWMIRPRGGARRDEARSWILVSPRDLSGEPNVTLVLTCAASEGSK